jgi:DNA repair exonuclease SbcCD nuclease subunit
MSDSIDAGRHADERLARFGFIHAADLHIDSPLRGLDAYEGAPVERLRGATRQALAALVDLALERQVAMVVLAGDVYDGDWADFRTGLYFREQMLRLTRSGVKVFLVKGNHDAESQITRQLPGVDGVHVFSAQKSETVDLPSLGVAIHGRSFPNRAVPEDLVPLYPAPLADRFNIGVLHTSLTGREGHDPYAPTTPDALISKGYDYFALGHVHAREVVREASPRIVYPGNLQGRHARETGPKGCELVSVENGLIVDTEFIALDAVRWHLLELDASGIDDLDALARTFCHRAVALTAGAQERLHALRIALEVSARLHRLEAGQPGTLAAALQAATQEIDAADLWIESVRVLRKEPVDREALAGRNDAVSELLALVDALDADPVALRAWILARLDEIGPLPALLADADPRNFDDASLRALLDGAEATVLARIVAPTGAGASR